MSHFLDKFFGDPNQKTLKRLQVLVEQINQQEPTLEKLTDQELKQRSAELRQRVQQQLASTPKTTPLQLPVQLPVLTRAVQEREQTVLDQVVPKAFALVREAAKRTLGQRHFDEQLIAGLVLHEGNVAEQKTGEGKTLSSTLPSYLNALVGRGVHVITVNDYLAKRDAGWMGQIFDFLGLSVGCLTHQASFLFSTEAFQEENEGQPPANEDPTDENNPSQNLRPCTRQEAYAADITYGTNNEFGFDYLRDNMTPAPKYLRQRPLYFGIIDEVDSILIDEARTPLIISAPAEESGDLYTQFAGLVPRLTADDLEIDEKERAVTLTELGIKKMQNWLQVENLYEDENVLLVHHLDEALKAEYLFKRDKDYVVKADEVIIVDEFTGRLMPGRRYSEGLHQAIEAKEGVHVQRESDTLATISIQNYFRIYQKIAGMTGTAKTEEEEFIKTYNMEVVVVSTHREMIRRDQSDKVYINETAKFKAIIEDVKERRQRQQPVLIGTISVAKNEHLSKLLQKAGVPHEILNAKNHQREAGIVANAGAPGAVTLATNMAGRGTDIVLGGAPPEQADKKKYQQWEQGRAAVLEAGGLIVIGSERHESRRIDNQLRGRSGRQGECGESIFYVSMDDDLMRIFGGEKMKGLMQRANFPEDMPIQNSIVSRSIEQAQKRVEGHNYDIRKHVLQYDDVMNKHREALYKKRLLVMGAAGEEGNDPKTKQAAELKGVVRNIIHNQAIAIVRRYTNGDRIDWNEEELLKEFWQLVPAEPAEQQQLANQIHQTEHRAEAEKLIANIAIKTYEQREQTNGVENQRLLERAVMLRTIDELWIEHLNVMQDLRQGVGLQAVAQNDPLVVYQQQGYERFQELMQAINFGTAHKLLHLTKMSEEEVRQRRLILQGASEADAGGGVGIQTANLSAEQQAQLQQAQANAAATGQQVVDSSVRQVEEQIQNNQSSNDNNGESEVSITVRKIGTVQNSQTNQTDTDSRVADRLAAAGRQQGQASRPNQGQAINGNRKRKIGRNDPCWCGAINPNTGRPKKFKNCHGA